MEKLPKRMLKGTVEKKLFKVSTFVSRGRPFVELHHTPVLKTDENLHKQA